MKKVERKKGGCWLETGMVLPQLERDGMKGSILYSLVLANYLFATLYLPKILMNI